MRKQYGYPQATVGRGFRLFSRAVDPDEDKKPEESNVWRVLRNIQALCGNLGGSHQDFVGESYSGDVTSLPELDPTWLHLRDDDRRCSHPTRKSSPWLSRPPLTSPFGQFLEAPDFRNLTLKCLAEVASLNVGPEYDPKFVSLFEMVMTAINRMVPPNTNIAQAYAHSNDAGQEFILSLALFLGNFLQSHLRTVENERTQDVLLNAHLYMVKISQVDEREIFKICLEYWLKLVAELYDEIQSLPIGDSGLLMGLSLGSNGAHNMLNGVSLRKNIYSDVLSNLRLVVIEKMVKPEEVRVVLRGDTTHLTLHYRF